jgi:hypothetical protein
VEDVSAALTLSRASVAELPKDLLDQVSIKQLFRTIRAASKEVSLAATTDFAHLGGMDWADYGRYLDIQVAQARFLGARLFRVFLQADTQEDFIRALYGLERYTRRVSEMEIVVETHGGWESTAEGLPAFLKSTDARLVVDFGNIADEAASEFILRGAMGERIAYFHLRALPGAPSTDPLLDRREARAMNAYPTHSFLWEPKGPQTPEALAIWHRLHAGTLA